MEFGPFQDLDLDRLTTYHKQKTVPAKNARPRVPHDYFGFADIILEHIRNGKTTHERVKQRLQELNPTLSVRTNLSGSICRDELAYCIRVNYLRAISNSHYELLQ